MSTHHPLRSAASLFAACAIGAAALTACGSTSDQSATPAAQAAETPSTTSAAHDMSTMSATVASDADQAKVTALNGAMRTLWHQHMEWTFITVDAFFHDPDAVDAYMDRLLQNQQDIGDAIATYYGDDAGKKLAALLTEHIQDAVPVLEAAKADDSAALQKATDTWYANAKEIGAFLASANPDNWPASATESMMKDHITQTIDYSVALLKGDYAGAVEAYSTAEKHMAIEMADTLTNGIVAQFPDRFAG